MILYAPYLFVQDTEGSTSDYTEFSEMLEPSATWKTKFQRPQSWLKILKKADWTTRLFGPISRRLTLGRSSAELMQSLAATLASRFPLQESGEEQKTPGTCGHTLQESLTLFGQESVSLKTSGGTFDWDCPKCLANSESLATELGRVYSQRRKSAPRTDESGSLSWPTHRAGKPGGESEANFMLRKSQGKQATPPLALAVLMMWPTASARDYKDTPGMAQEAFDTSGKFRNRIDQLARAVYWRTPSASDGEGGGIRHGESPKARDETEAQTAGPCPGWPAGPGEAQREWEEPRTIDRKLNPAWVAQLMGLPSDWVEVEGLTREMKLRALGNGVVPQQAELAIRTLLQ